MSSVDCADIVVSWAERESRRLRRPPRQNVRLLFGDAVLAAAVRARLEAVSGAEVWYVVRTSADADAVAQRHGRPRVRPDSVLETTPLLYLVFWTPGVRTQDGSHDANAQSLADLDAFDLRQLLSNSHDFRLELELAIERQCAEAANTWPEQKRDLAREHLVAAWDALRCVLREQAGGKERSLPFVTELEDYVRFLKAARVPDAEWSATPEADRAGRLFRAWGAALVALGMFKVPAIGDFIGVSPAGKLPRKPNPDILQRDLANMLAENLDAAADHHELGERIAGKWSLAQRLDNPPVALAQEDPQGAARALFEFCTERNEQAFDIVEWLFRKEPGKKRSESQGLKGLLIQRGARQRRDPVERAVAETRQLFENALSSPEAVEAAQKLVESRRVDVETNARTASKMAIDLEALARRQVPEGLSDPALRHALDDALQAGKLAVAACEALAKAWRTLAGIGEASIRREKTLLVGLVRVVALHGSQLPDGAKLMLQLHTEANVAIGKEHVLSPSVDGVEALRSWLRASLAAVDAPREEDDSGEERPEADPDQEAFEDVTTIRVDVTANTSEPTLLGQFTLGWSHRSQQLLASTQKDTLRSWEAKTSRVQRPAQDLRALFEKPGQPVNAAPGYMDAWYRFHQALGIGKNSEIAAALGPLPTRQSRELVDAWAGQLLRAVGDGRPSQAEIAEKIKQARAAGDLAGMDALIAQLTTGAVQAPEQAPLTQEQTRDCLRAMTGMIELHGERTIYLTPYHPLVLRLRVLAEEVLTECLTELTSSSWSAESAAAIAEALERWGFPEPAVTYGGLWEGEPLAFDGWTHESFPRFVPHRPAVATDLEKLGLPAARSTLEQYLTLHPSARDRLSLRVQADPDGRWPWRLVTSLLDDEDLGLDVALVTARSAREATFFEGGAHGTEHRRLLELGDDGTPPRVRFRRDGTSPASSAHIAVTVGTSSHVFTPKLTPVRVGNAEVRPTWSKQRLFEATQWESRDNGIIAGVPRFELELRLARAIAYAAKGGSDIFLERISIDPTVVREAITDLHRNAHWLVVITRQPVHGVIEAAGEDVAMLLDFRTRIEAGRPLHICTSMGKNQFEFDLRRLRAALARLLDMEVTMATTQAVIRAARRFAPGAAMTCTGTTSLAHVQGLLGLLLTREAARGSVPCAAIPIDQHGELLSAGPSAMRSDILVVDDAKTEVVLRVVEAKVSKDPPSVVGRGSEQVVQTCKKLSHFERHHPLMLRTREELARALDVQAEIAADDDMHRIARKIRNEMLPIRVAPIEEHAVHVWSLASEATPAPVDTSDKPRCVMHSREELIARLAILGN